LDVKLCESGPWRRRRRKRRRRKLQEGEKENKQRIIRRVHLVSGLHFQQFL
jgi:hypothetical protein